MYILQNRYNLDPIIAKARTTVASHTLEEPGSYARWLWQNKEGTRELGKNAYGCADAANILYTIGDFPSSEAERRSWIKHLQSLQDKNTGEYHESTHFVLHTTAHCIAALELFDQKPLHALKFLAPFRQKEELYALLEGLSWIQSPWNNSHKGAGIFTALVLAGEADAQWKKWYFDWLWQEADPKTGLWRRGCTDAPGSAPLGHHMASTFHYLFNHESEKMPLRYPHKMVDTCLDIFHAGSSAVIGCENFNRRTGFMEIDWVYCLNRAFRQSGRKPAQVKEAVSQFAKILYEYLMDIEERTDEGFNDLHMLFGTLCALAETSQSVYGIYTASRPLRLVLDRRPFI